jgi:hypothetical protein
MGTRKPLETLTFLSVPTVPTHFHCVICRKKYFLGEERQSNIFFSHMETCDFGGNGGNRVRKPLVLLRFLRSNFYSHQIFAVRMWERFCTAVDGSRCFYNNVSAD